MSKIEIEVSAGGVGSIKVDGKQIDGVSAIDVKIRPYNATVVKLELVGDVLVTADGAVVET